MNHEEPSESETMSNSCQNPECIKTAAALKREYANHEDAIRQYNAMSHDAQFQVWRAGNAVGRARALRTAATFVLYTTAFYHIIFSDYAWVRAGALVMIALCYQAMHMEA